LTRAFHQLGAFIGRFHNSPEGRIFFFALICAIFFIVSVVAMALLSEQGKETLAMLVYHFVAGRMGGISRGLHDEAHLALVFWMSFGIETLVTLLTYPLAIYSSKEVIRQASFQRSLGRIMSTAERYRAPARRWGIPGLLLFNWLPIYLTGPLVAAIMARLIGFSDLAALLISTVGTALSVLIWMWTIDPIIEASRQWSFTVPTAIVVAALAYALIHHLRARKRAASPSAKGPDHD